MDVLRHLFEQHFRSPAERVQPLRAELGASPRRLFRLSNSEHTAIGVLYDVREENVAFLEFSRHFRRRGLPVPQIYAEDLDHGAYLEEDLGDTTLYEFLAGNRDGENINREALDIYRQVLTILPRFQIEGGRGLDYKLCYPRASFDRQSIAWDLNYFKYYFLHLANVPFNEQALQDDFERLTKVLLEPKRNYFLYRDFQSRNIMLRDGQPYFLDYQGGRKGALQYDIASLLYDAKADLPPDFRQELLNVYLEALAKLVAIDRDEFLRYFYPYVYVRIMQALGAYGFRGFYERKSHFLKSVPYALRNLRWLLANAELPSMPALTQVLTTLANSEKLYATTAEPEHLTIRVFSFSYHRELPRDDSGHGGGFVFDARSLPNPGREERFKSLTGKDAPVAEYLDREESVHQYLDNAAALVDASIRQYQSRGFKNLMVSFGCTGGQHRSVYLAEQMAKHLREKNSVAVSLQHLELERLGK